MYGSRVDDSTRALAASEWPLPLPPPSPPPVGAARNLADKDGAVHQERCYWTAKIVIADKRSGMVVAST
jgi:hypothetical protein